MKHILIALALILIAASASACSAGYYCGGSYSPIHYPNSYYSMTYTYMSGYGGYVDYAVVGYRTPYDYYDFYYSGPSYYDYYYSSPSYYDYYYAAPTYYAPVYNPYYGVYYGRGAYSAWNPFYYARFNW